MPNDKCGFCEVGVDLTIDYTHLVKRNDGTFDEYKCLAAPPAEVREPTREVYDFWETFPHCCGYPKCDGDLVGIDHSEACPLYGKEEITLFEFAEAWGERRYREGLEAAAQLANRLEKGGK